MRGGVKREKDWKKKKGGGEKMITSSKGGRSLQFEEGVNIRMSRKGEEKVQGKGGGKMGVVSGNSL